MTSSTRGKWSAVGSIVSAPVRGYYYPGRVKALKRSVDGQASSNALYSVVFSDPLGSIDELNTEEHGLILDFTADQLIGRGFEPITRALLSENQKVFITHKGREVSARVVKHEEDDMLRLRLDSPTESLEMSVKLHEVRLLPSRKSGRLQEHPDYSLLASGRRSPDEELANNKAKASNGSGRRRTTSSSSNSLLLCSESSKDSGPGPLHMVSAHIDVPQQSGRKRRTSNPDVMDECTAALVLMSLSASPRSPSTFLTERLFKCTWPGCLHETFKCSDIEQHVRKEHLNKLESDPGEEEFYYTEVDLRQRDSLKQQPPFSSTSMTHSSGPDSPVSLSEDAASTSSSTSAVMTGDNSMDSNPPSPESSNFFKSNSAFVPVHQYRHLEDHEYNRRPDPAGISILGSGASRRGRKGNNSSSVLSHSGTSSHPINIPSMESDSHPMMSSSFGGFSGASSYSAESGFGSYNSFGSSFTPLSPPRSSGSLSSSLSSNSHKYLRIGTGRGSPGTTLLQNGGINRTSPTKRVRGETRKCRKVYGMEKKEAWCTQCKWKKACTRFLD